MKKLTTSFLHLANLLTHFRFKPIRNLYWNIRAKGIHNTWGSDEYDYKVLKEIIQHVKPNKLLDVGCGSGRCFPLYFELNISEVVAQDISSNALNICKGRFPNLPYKLFRGSIMDIPYPKKYFDLIISSRVLSAVMPEDIENILNKLGQLSDYIYINEMTDSDYTGPSTYWFKHDYEKIMKKNHFVIEKKTNIGNQTCLLYRDTKKD